MERIELHVHPLYKCRRTGAGDGRRPVSLRTADHRPSVLRLFRPGIVRKRQIAIDDLEPHSARARGDLVANRCPCTATWEWLGVCVGERHYYLHVESHCMTCAACRDYLTVKRKAGVEIVPTSLNAFLPPGRSPLRCFFQTASRIQASSSFHCSIRPDSVLPKRAGYWSRAILVASISSSLTLKQTLHREWRSSIGSMTNQPSSDNFPHRARLSRVSQ